MKVQNQKTYQLDDTEIRQAILDYMTRKLRIKEAKEAPTTAVEITPLEGTPGFEATINITTSTQQ